MNERDRARSDPLAGLAERVSAVVDASVELVEHVVDHVGRMVDDIAEETSTISRDLDDLLQSESFRTVRETLRATPRLARIGGEALRILAAYRWHTTTRAARIERDGAGAEQRALEHLHRRSARRLQRLCVELRGGVLKLGQYASTRADRLPPAYVRVLSQLQDRVPPAPAREVGRRLDLELGAAWRDRFLAFEPEPIAAASLSQVHGATLRDGTRVAVKVLAPGIEQLVETDLAAVRLLAPLLAEAIPRVAVGTFADELSRAVRRELDLEAEARHLEEFAVCFEDDPDIVVPRVHHELSSRRVLTLDRIDGQRLVDYLDTQRGHGPQGALGIDRVFELLVRGYAVQLFRHGLLHADPHPGNFLVLEGSAGPRLAWVDFGCVEHYAPERRIAYAALARALLQADEARMAQLFEQLGFRSRTGAPDSLRAYGERLVALLRPAMRADASALGSDLHERILEVASRDPVVAVPRDFVLMSRVLAALGGLLARYRPGIELHRIVGPALRSAAH